MLTDMLSEMFLSLVFKIHFWGLSLTHRLAAVRSLLLALISEPLAVVNASHSSQKPSLAFAVVLSTVFKIHFWGLSPMASFSCW